MFVEQKGRWMREIKQKDCVAFLAAVFLFYRLFKRSTNKNQWNCNYIPSSKKGTTTNIFIHWTEKYGEYIGFKIQKISIAVHKFIHAQRTCCLIDWSIGPFEKYSISKIKKSCSFIIQRYGIFVRYEGNSMRCGVEYVHGAKNMAHTDTTKYI